MNAYELAETVDKWAYSESAEYLIDAANMLRQQADRIAELENEVKRLVGAEPISNGKLTFCKNCGQQDPYNIYVDGEIAGWLGYHEGHLVSFLQTQEKADDFLTRTNPVGQVRPVFTSPKIKLQTKPLSDEEINELIVNKVTDYELCRAIEERHGIK